MDWRLLLLILMGHSSFLMGQLYDYHYIEQNKRWSEAQEYCQRVHTDLATVYDMNDMKRLCGNTHECKVGWIGLRYQKVDCTWQWSLPGVEFNKTHTNWAKDEPNNDKQEKIEYYVKMKDTFEWQDTNGDDRVHFICYDEKLSSKYKKINSTKTWLEAQKYCREHHTDLISGRDQLDELKKKNTTLDGQSWIIGLFRDRWRWSDGNGSSFRNWDQSPEQNHCAATMENGRWKSEPCDKAKYFYCYDDNVILIPQNKTWTEALNYCREHHDDLAYVRNKHQQRWVGQIARKANSPYVWLGLRYTCTLQFWFWVTDKALCYNNWAKSDQSTDHCDMSAAMETGGRNEWYKKPDQTKYNFICSKS